MEPETHPEPPVRDETWAKSGQGEDGQQRPTFPVTKSKSTPQVGGGGVPETDADPGNTGGDQPAEPSVSPSEGEANPAVAEHDDKTDEESEEDEVIKEDASHGSAPISAKSDISLVGFPSESEHRVLMRRVKAEMNERLHNAAERQTRFLERSYLALQRSQELAASIASRQLRQKQRRLEADANATDTDPESHDLEGHDPDHEGHDPEAWRPWPWRPAEDLVMNCSSVTSWWTCVLYRFFNHCMVVYGVHRACAETAAVSHGISHITTKQCCKYNHFENCNGHL